MRRLGLLLAVLALAVPATAAPSILPGTFRVGTGVACSAAGRALVCAGARAGSMELRATGAPVSTRRRVASTPATRLLRPGQTWRLGAISCRAAGRPGRAEIACTNRTGAVLRLSASRVVVLADSAGASYP